MNRDAYFKFHADFYGKMRDIALKKNKDYAANHTNPFSNFTAIEGYNIGTEIGFITRMSDKLSRLAGFALTGKLSVEDESVQDTLMDLANYCILFAGYLASKQKPFEQVNDTLIDALRSGEVAAND